MLGLKVKTNAQWCANAILHLDDLIVDHAHCEKKAAAFALSMIQRYPDKTRLVMDMVEIVNEEMEHFKLVMQWMAKRNLQLTNDRGNGYANQLHRLMRKEEPHRLLDSLLIGAMIEARSCERFTILSTHCPDEELRDFYKSLLASEAGHYHQYTDIAREYFPRSVVSNRLRELLEQEAAIVESLPNKASMHG